MNKLLELDTKKIKKVIYGKSAEIADKVGMRKGRGGGIRARARL